MARPVMCGTLGHEDRAASHKATWTVYGGGLKSQRLCDECASRALARGVQRGLQIETLPSFRGVHESGGV